MSRVELSPGIESWHGKVSGSSGMTMRQKKFKDDKGRVIKKGPQEYYKKRQRDYKMQPRTEREEAQRLVWQAACREASKIVKDKSHPRYAELRERWNAQFDGGCDAMLNEGRKVKVVYGMFPVFVRMVLLKEKRTGRSGVGPDVPST